jgi:hypothetical protein
MTNHCGIDSIETDYHSPSLYQRGSFGETQRSPLSIPLLKRNTEETERSSLSLPLHKEKPWGNLPPSTREKRCEKHKGHLSPSLYQREPWEKHTGHHFPSLYQIESPETLPPSTKEKRWEKHKVSIPLLKRNKGETKWSSISLPLHKEKPRGKLPPSTREKP